MKKVNCHENKPSLGFSDFPLDGVNLESQFGVKVTLKPDVDDYKTQKLCLFEVAIDQLTH